MKKALTILVFLPLFVSAQRGINIPSRCNVVIPIDTAVYWGYGQSNREGEARTRWGVDTNLNASLLQLSRGRFTGSNGQIVKLDFPVEFIGNSANKVSMDVDIAAGIYTGNGNRPVVGHFAGQGGTAIANFLPGHGSGIWSAFTSRYYTYLKPRFNRKTVAFTWHQGETDESIPNTYLTKLRTLVDSVRNVTGQTTPVFIGGLCPFYGTDGMRSTIQAKLIAAPDSISGVYYVTSSGCLGSEDAFHFTSPALRKLGDRYSKLIQHVVYKTRYVPEEPVFNTYYTSTTAALIDYDYIYSPLRIKRVEVYVAGVLAGAQDSPTQEIQGAGGSSISISGVTISGQPVYVRALNDKGWVYSDTLTSTYSGTVPTPSYSWLLNETSGTTVTATNGGINGTLSVDASTVASTLNGSNAFNFTGTQFVTLASDITTTDTFSISWECDPSTILTNSIVGNPATEKYIMVAIETSKVGINTAEQDRVLVSPDMRANHKTCLVFIGPRVRVYVDGAFVAEDASAAYTANLVINNLGGGHSGFRMNGIFRNIKIWQNTALQPGQIAQL